jgi:hypothetical protein
MYHIFQHWIKKNKINFPHRHQTYGYEWSISVEGWQPSWYGVSFCFRNTNKSFLARRRHFPNDMESVSASETPTNLSSLEADIFQTIWSQSFRFRNTNKSFLAGRRYFPHDNWQLGEMLDIVLSEFCPDICPWADIAVALPVFTYELNWCYYLRICDNAF